MLRYTVQIYVFSINSMYCDVITESGVNSNYTNDSRCLRGGMKIVFLGGL